MSFDVWGFSTADPDWSPTVITFGSFFEETPEGLARMDRIRAAEDARRAAMEPWEREIEDAINVEIDRAVFGLPPAGGPGGPSEDPTEPLTGQDLS